MAGVLIIAAIALMLTLAFATYAARCEWLIFRLRAQIRDLEARNDRLRLSVIPARSRRTAPETPVPRLPRLSKSRWELFDTIETPAASKN